MSRRILLGIVAAGLFASLAWTIVSATGPSKGRARQTEFECRWAETPIKITGKGTDPAWKNAQTIDDFYLPWLGDKARPAKTKTRAKLLWDREYLYFFADLEDADLFALVKEHNGRLWEGNVFEL